MSSQPLLPGIRLLRVQRISLEMLKTSKHLELLTSEVLLSSLIQMEMALIGVD
jgi:hypothetical protein